MSPEIVSVYQEPSQTNYSVDAGNTIVFYCSATGIPAPFITWFRSRIELNTVTNPRVTVNDPSHPISSIDGEGEITSLVSRTLSLAMSEYEDYGSYECRANNVATPGEHGVFFNLIVQSNFSIICMETVKILTMKV